VVAQDGQRPPPGAVVVSVVAMAFQGRQVGGG
jgi:hypothetical protein